MGDSFSAGEGVEPFLYGTAEPGTNECHRSEDAYAMLLEKDSSLNLDLKAFVACSGAETGDVLDGDSSTGNRDEGPQVNSLSASTDLVTLTIGGNDVGFVPFLEACFQLGDSCDSSSTAYATANGKILGDLTDDLTSVFLTMQAKLAGNEDVKVLVVGYPEIITGASMSPAAPWSCLAALTTADMSSVQALTGDANGVIENSLTTLGDDRFHYVDPMASPSEFGLHDMCSDDWYIYPYDLGRPKNYIAHPTRKGQEEYAKVIKHYLEAIS